MVSTKPSVDFYQGSTNKPERSAVLESCDRWGFCIISLFSALTLKPKRLPECKLRELENSSLLISLNSCEWVCVMSPRSSINVQPFCSRHEFLHTLQLDWDVLSLIWSTSTAPPPSHPPFSPLNIYFRLLHPTLSTRPPLLQNSNVFVVFEVDVHLSQPIRDKRVRPWLGAEQKLEEKVMWDEKGRSPRPLKSQRQNPSAK